MHIDSHSIDHADCKYHVNLTSLFTACSLECVPDSSGYFVHNIEHNLLKKWEIYFTLCSLVHISDSLSIGIHYNFCSIRKVKSNNRKDILN